MSFDLPPRIAGLLKAQYLTAYTILDLSSLPTRAIKGIGKIYEEKLRSQGIISIEDLANLQSFQIEPFPPKLLEKWIIAAKIVLRFVDEGMPVAIPRKKLIVAGLDHAGKTSVLESLRAMRSIAANRATLGARATSLLFAGFNLISFDLGGQTTFRETYLAQADVFFTDVGTLVFVIDIQALHRQNEAFDYFGRILKLLRYLKEDPPLSVLFHKYDPSGLDKDDVDRICSDLEEQYREVSTSLGFKSLDFYRTTIYDISNLAYTFSHVFSRISPVSGILNDTLGWFCEEQGFYGCHLFSENWFIIAQWLDKVSKGDRDDVFLKSLQAVRSAVKNGIPEKGETVEISPYYFYAREIPVGKTKVVISLFDTRPGKIKHSELESLDEMLTPWIQNFFALM
ncbi:MAG: ADP-ribosylation factor-like protein [Candidatus Thorarchaeota archaeon]